MVTKETCSDWVIDHFCLQCTLDYCVMASMPHVEQLVQVLVYVSGKPPAALHGTIFSAL